MDVPAAVGVLLGRLHTVLGAAPLPVVVTAAEAVLTYFERKWQNPVTFLQLPARVGIYAGTVKHLTNLTSDKVLWECADLVLTEVCNAVQQGLPLREFGSNPILVAVGQVGTSLPPVSAMELASLIAAQLAPCVHGVAPAQSLDSVPIHQFQPQPAHEPALVNASLAEVAHAPPPPPMQLLQAPVQPPATFSNTTPTQQPPAPPVPPSYAQSLPLSQHPWGQQLHRHSWMYQPWQPAQQQPVQVTAAWGTVTSARPAPLYGTVPGYALAGGWHASSAGPPAIGPFAEPVVISRNASSYAAAARRQAVVAAPNASAEHLPAVPVSTTVSVTYGAVTAGYRSHQPPPPPPPRTPPPARQSNLDSVSELVTSLSPLPESHVSSMGQQRARGGTNNDLPVAHPRGMVQTLSPAVASWILSGGLEKLHVAALQQTQLIHSNLNGILVSPDIDFGIQQIVHVEGLTNNGADEKHITSQRNAVVSVRAATDMLHGDKQGTSSSMLAVLAQTVNLREFRFHNGSNSCCSLISIRAAPAYAHCITLLDDHQLSQQDTALVKQQLHLLQSSRSHASSVGTSPDVAMTANSDAAADSDDVAAVAQQVRAVVLQPGDEYSVTVALSRDGRCFGSRDAKGLLATYVLLTFTVELDSNAAADLQAKAVLQRLQYSAATGKSLYAMVVARRVSVALVDSTALMSSLLRFDAQPYVPDSIRTLFDSMGSFFTPSDFNPLVDLYQEAKHPNTHRDVYMSHTHAPRTAGGHIVAACAQVGWAQVNRAKAVEQLAAACKQKHGPDAALHRAQCEALVHVARLLIAEEACLEREVRSYNLYSARLLTALFSPDGAQYCLSPKPVELKTEGDEWRVAEPRRWRGPRMPILLKHSNLTPTYWRRMLLAVDVPGLLEEKPYVMIGDAAYLRLVDDPYHEWVAHVVHVDQSTLLMTAGKGFWQQHMARFPQPPSGDGGRKPLLVHVCFTFDRTPLHRMHEALLRIAKLPRSLLPPHATSGMCAATADNGADGSAVAIGGMGKAVAAADGTQGNAPAKGTTANASGTTTAKGATATASITSATAASRALALSNAEVLSQLAASMKLKGRTNLNHEQRMAIACMLSGGGATLPFVLFGPPGTGKTVTLVECAMQLLNKRKDCRLLLCAPQNYSADLICSALAELDVGVGTMLRLHDPRRRKVEVKPDVLRYSNFSEQLDVMKLPDPIRVAIKQVVVCTCSAAGLLREGDFLRTPGGPLQFDYVLVDEAGQALLPEVLIPLSLLAPRGCALLAGDPRQLGPIVHSYTATHGGLATSLLELMINHYAHTGALQQSTDFAHASAALVASEGSAAQHASLAGALGAEDAVPGVVMLVRNYRSHVKLLELPSRLFYSNTLQACVDAASVQAPKWDQLQTYPDTAEDGDELSVNNMLFFGVRGAQHQQGDTPSYFNPIEAAALADLVENLVYQRAADGRSAVLPTDIGVICTYRRQVQKIRQLLRERGLGAVRVGTVDDYQGQEARVIFISTVLSRPESLPRRPALAAFQGSAAMDGTAVDGPQAPLAAGRLTGPVAPVGFWSNPKRFNVAITRAKALLVVVGHPLVLMQDPYWKEAVRYCAARGGYRGAGNEIIQRLLRQEAVDDDLFRLLNLDLMDGTEAGDDVEMEAMVNQIAELALLGAGDASKIYPETMDEFFEQTYCEEMPFRVAL